MSLTSFTLLHGEYIFFTSASISLTTFAGSEIRVNCLYAMQCSLLAFLSRHFLTLPQLSDEYADTEIDINGDGSMKGCINDLRSLKKRYPNLKTILSIGGGGKGSVPFPAVTSNGIVRTTFAQSARQIVDAFGFDGMDCKRSHDPGYRS